MRDFDRKKAEEKLEETRKKHDKVYRQILAIEKRFPAFTRISRHPRYGHWVPVGFAVVEVALSFVAFGLFGYLLSIIPWPSIDIPFPSIDLPSIPLPDINLPSIPFPDIDFPDLPEWLQTTLYWMKRTWPIWVAVAFAIFSSRKKSK